MLRDRPHLVGLVCWVLILCNMYGIFTTMKQMGSPAFATSLEGYPYPPWAAEAILFLTLALPGVFAICMYERVGWARYPYIAVMILYFAHGYLTIHGRGSAFAMHRLEGKFLLFALSIVILFLPAARRFFHPPTYIDE